MEALFDWVIAQGGPDFRTVRRLPAGERRNWDADQRARKADAARRGEFYKMKNKPAWMRDVTEV